MHFQIQGGLWDVVGVVGADVDAVEAVKYVSLLTNFCDSLKGRLLCCRENLWVILRMLKELYCYFTILCDY